MNEVSSTVKDHLRFLYGDAEILDCFEGPYEDCKHPPNNDLFSYKKQVVSDNESDRLKDESDQEDGSNKEEPKGEEMEGDSLKEDEEGNGLK